MYKVAWSFGWFALGCCSAFLFMYASIFTHASAAVAPLNPSSEDWIPKVPPLPSIIFEDVEFRNGVIQLDGLNCKKCMFENATLEYSGGELALLDSSWNPGTIKVVFKGAALNALQVLALAQAMSLPTPPKTLPPKPRPKEIPIKMDKTMDWIVK